MKRTQIIALILMFTFLLPLWGCSEPLPEVEQERYSAFTDELFLSLISQSTINLRLKIEDPEAFGIDRSNITLGDYSPEAFKTLSSSDRAFNKELLTFNRNLLTPEQQKEYDALKSILGSLVDDEFLLYQNILSPFSGVTTSLPILLDEIQFYTKQDIDDYIMLLRDVPRAFDEIELYLQAQSDQGLFMPDYSADDVIEQIGKFVDQSDNNILILSFNERVDEFPDLSESERAQYKTDNMTAVKENVITAYEKLRDVVSRLKGTGKNDSGVSNFKNGKKYYEQLVRAITGLDESVDEILQDIENAIIEYDDAVMTLLRNNPDLQDRHNNLDYGETDPEKLMVDLENKFYTNFPEISDVDYILKDLPEALEEYMSSAFYVVPPIDNTQENIIYINNSLIDETNVYTTLVHEGYPGHLYVNNYIKDKITPLHFLLNFSGYHEGWAVYVELINYDTSEYAENDLECAEFIRLNTQFSYALLSKMDIGVNYLGWSLDDALEEMSMYFGSSGVREVYEMLTQDPGDYLKYFSTYRKFDALRQKAQDSLGNAFSLKEFHKVILDVGPSSFDVVEQAVDQYIASHDIDDELQQAA